MKFLRGLRALFRKEELDKELSDELAFHLEKQIEQNIAAGMSAKEARYAALKSFGGVEQVKEECRDAWGVRFIDTLLQDIRFGLRMLVKNPGFTVVAVITLALGIGTNTAIFSVIEWTLLRSLPYPSADHLVSVGVVVPSLDLREFLFGSGYAKLRDRGTPFQQLTSLDPGGEACDLTEANPIRLSCAQVECTFLTTFGVQPALGRNFTREEDRPNAPRVALLSHSLWLSRFAGSKSAIGVTIPLDGHPVTIIGVLPKDFEMPNLASVDVLVPESIDWVAQRAAAPGRPLRVFARLKPGVSIVQAGLQLQPFFREFVQSAPPQFRKEIKLSLRSIRDIQVHDIRVTLPILLGAVLMILLIACSNVAGLQLARSTVRQVELAVRTAVGARRARLARQMMTESLLLGVVGGTAGCLLGSFLLRVFVGLAPTGIPRLRQARLDLGVLTFTACISIFAGVLAGVTSVVALPRPDVLAGGQTIGRLQQPLRSVLVAAQIAMSLVLLSSAGLLLRSLSNLKAVRLGMQTGHVISAQITLGKAAYAQPARRAAFFEQLEARVQGLPGLSAVAVSDSLPPAGAMRTKPYFALQVEGKPPLEKGTGGMVAWRAVTPEYFATLRIPIIKGRPFREDDRDSEESVIILSQLLATRLLPNQNPLEQHIRLGPEGPIETVVGIAADVRNAGLVDEQAPEYYLVRKHRPDFGLSNQIPADALRGASLIIRSLSSTDVIARQVRTEVTALDPTLPVRIETMDDRVSALRDRPRFHALSLSLFAALALVLAAVGIYGVTSYSVAQRTHEIGVRMSLGARRSEVLVLVLRQGIKLTLIGVFIGLVGSLAMTRLLQNSLYGVTPTDPMTFASVSLLLIAVSLLANYVPARPRSIPWWR